MCLFTMALPPWRGLLEATTTVLIFNRNGSNTAGAVIEVVVVGESVAVWSTWLCECSVLVCSCPCVLCVCLVLVSV